MTLQCVQYMYKHQCTCTTVVHAMVFQVQTAALARSVASLLMLYWRDCRCFAQLFFSIFSQSKACFHIFLNFTQNFRIEIKIQLYRHNLFVADCFRIEILGLPYNSVRGGNTTWTFSIPVKIEIYRPVGHKNRIILYIDINSY